MPRPSHLTTVYATDEDIFVESPADFGLLVPSSNAMAEGSDGAFSPSDRWTLTSASNDFGAQGVAPGMVIELKSVPGANSPFKVNQFLAVESVSGSSVTLRRAGYDVGVGKPPGPPGGATGVPFKVLSMGPQIDNAAYVLENRYSVDPRIPNRDPGSLADQRVFRRLVALWTLYQFYLNDNRSKEGDWAAKTKQYQQQYEDALDSAVVRWGPSGQTLPDTTRFSTRVTR